MIFDHQFGGCRDFGDAPDVAFERAVGRIRGIEDDIPSLGNLPFQETLEPSILEDLGYVTKGRAVFYCLVNKRFHDVQVLGIFFGGWIIGSICLNASRHWRTGNLADATIPMPDRNDCLSGLHWALAQS